MAANPDKIKLNIVSPTVPCDGNAIGINPDGTINLLFFQITNVKEDHVAAISTSVTRITEEQAEKLVSTINEALAELRQDKKK